MNTARIVLLLVGAEDTEPEVLAVAFSQLKMSVRLFVRYDDRRNVLCLF